MVGLTVDLIEKMNNHLQIGNKAPNVEITVYKNKGNGEFEPFRFNLKDIINLKIDRRWNMAADEIQISISNVNGKYSPDFSPHKKFKGVGGLEYTGFKDILKSFNKIECNIGYGNQLVRIFTGQIVKVDIVENPPTITITGQNAYRKLLKPIDPITHKQLIYENKKAFEIVQDLCKRAGVDNLIFDIDTVDDKDFSINKVVFELGTNYSDAIRLILDTMNHRIVGGRYGEIRVLKKLAYSQQDFHNWEFSDYVNLTSGNYSIDPSLIRNRLIIMSDSGWQAFQDPFLIKYCNNEIISAAISIPWATDIEQKWDVADDYFMQMRRKLRRITIGVIGNPAIDVGDLVQVELLTSTATEKYLVVAMSSSMSPNGYIDQIDLEHVNAISGRLSEQAEGEYINTQESDEDGTKANVTMDIREQIVDYAKSFLGTYYQWGGNFPETSGHYGLDCSHFTYQVLKKFGLMSSYMVSRQQKEWAIPITRDNLQKGDLVFYTWGTTVVRHVVMYIGNGQIIGANGGGPNTTTEGIARRQGAKVKIQNIDYGPVAYCGRPPNL